MRTTVSLDKDVEVAIMELRRSRGIGLSEAVNTLVRLGMVRARPSDYVYRAPTYEMHAKLDYTNTAELLDILDDH